MAVSRARSRPFSSIKSRVTILVVIVLRQRAAQRNDRVVYNSAMEMANRERPAVRVANSGDKRVINRLIRGAPFCHIHADWRLPVDWLGWPEFFLYEGNDKDGDLVAFLAATSKDQIRRAVLVSTGLLAALAYVTAFVVPRERLQPVDQLEHHRLVTGVCRLFGNELLARAGQAEDAAVGMIQIDEPNEDLACFGGSVLVADQLHLQPGSFLIRRLIAGRILRRRVSWSSIQARGFSRL